MCLKPQPPRPIPEETKALVGRMLDERTVYRFVGDVLFDRFHDEDFADLYSYTGQPAISPVLLSFVLIFKSLERCSNRQAANNVRFRLDWKYALHLPLDYAGFDQNVIAEFRHRLLDNGVEARIFNAIFKELRELGYYKPRGIQHTDSIAIETHYRTLHRIELMVETLRKAVHDLLREAPDWTRATLPGVWEERYSQRCKSERMKEEERQALSVTVGDDGQWLLERLEQDDAGDLRDIDAVETLRDVWSRHYYKDADGHMRWTADGERGGSQVIETPYDVEACWATKRKQDWIGYKLQVTETDDAGYPHLITDIALTNAAESDMAALEEIRARQKEQNTLPSERYVDSAYVSGELLKDGRKDYGEELIGPIRNTATAQSKIPNGFTHADFQVDWESKRVTCPAGHNTVIFSTGTQGLQATFKAKLCRACPLQARCCTGKKEGRSLRFGPHYPETQELRRRQKTDAFKRAYALHRSGIEACLSALMRGQGLRTTRHVGLLSNHLHALCAGAAVNLARVAAWRTGYRPQKRTATLGLVAGDATKPAVALAAVA
jgi:transposase